VFPLVITGHSTVQNVIITRCRSP